jgi:DHA3 family tetracycline resistance protein-like MFS transporter
MAALLTLLPPQRIYVGSQGAQAFLRTMATATYGVYAVRAAGLGPFELVLVGALLELSVVVAEVPTGIVADLRGRRLSVLIGLAVIGCGFGVMGAAPTFGNLALGSILWAVGGTFISGAHQAWLADEIGEAEAAPFFLRGTQARQIGSLLGIPIGVVLAAASLQRPMLAGALGYWALAVLLFFVMPERGYAPSSHMRGRPWHQMIATLRTGIATVRARPQLMSLLGVTFVVGMSGEAVGRLSPLHLLEGVGLPPAFAETTWFGIFQAGSFLGAAVITWLVDRSAALDDPRRIVRLLLVLTAAMSVATLTFALASTFWTAVFAFWAARWVRIVVEPLILALINRGVPPSVRATVLSMEGQAEAFGEVCGGPALGLLGTLRTVRTALVGAALILLPAFPLYGRALSAHREGRQ